MDLARNNAYPTPLKNNPFLSVLLLALATQRNAPKTTKTFKKEYDYIIVGAGSAGSVVASRLSEIPCVNVLLLEAGPAPPLLNDVPALARNFWNTDLDWDYKTVPQKHSAYGSLDRRVGWPGGKGLGGSSLLNAMLYVRGNCKNYDEWAANGAIGWSCSDLRPYFYKLEDNTDPDYISDGYHVVGGPVSVQKPRYEAEIKKPLIESALKLGYELVDINGRSQIGFYDHQANYRDGQRCSTAKAYLVPAENRTNLDIVINARVRKVLIEDGRAVGVEFDHENSTHTVSATREVIVSAGAVNTAQILQLSGIGPREHLESLNIPVKADLPVGDNFHDHSCSPVPFQLDPKIKSISEKGLRASTLVEYVQNKSGILTSNQGISLMAFLNNPQPEDNEVPDYALSFVEVPKEFVYQFGLTQKYNDAVFGPYFNASMFICLTQLLHPKSRGTVRLNSADPYDPPLIDPNYYEDPRDITDMVNAIKTCIKVATAKPMKKVGSRHLLNLVPGCEDFQGDDYYACFASSIIVTNSHPAGTAKMGDPDKPDTVVDPELKVKGIDGLRVVDNSIMPTIPTGNTNIPAMMIGEKGSDLIKVGIRCETQIPFVGQNDPRSPAFKSNVYSSHFSLGKLAIDFLGSLGNLLGGV